MVICSPVQRCCTNRVSIASERNVTCYLITNIKPEAVWEQIILMMNPLPWRSTGLEILWGKTMDSETTGRRSNAQLKVHHQLLQETGGRFWKRPSDSNTAENLLVDLNPCCESKEAYKYLRSWSDLQEERLEIPKSRIERRETHLLQKGICKLRYLLEGITKYWLSRVPRLLQMPYFFFIS